MYLWKEPVIAKEREKRLLRLAIKALVVNKLILEYSDRTVIYITLRQYSKIWQVMCPSAIILD